MSFLNNPGFELHISASVVTEPADTPSTVVMAGHAWGVRVEWSVGGRNACLLGGVFTVRAFIDAIGANNSITTRITSAQCQIESPPISQTPIARRVFLSSNRCWRALSQKGQAPATEQRDPNLGVAAVPDNREIAKNLRRT